MSLGSIFAALAVLLLAAVYIMRPFFKPDVSESDLLPTPYDDLLTQKEALMEQIRALEFDHDTGKLPDEEYNEHRADLVQQAADVLRQIDAMDSAESTPATASDIDEQIEAAVARRRKTKTPV
ncbi:MAG: hypothetical protein M9928_23075 [Anaerolineae bacterium]|nr:hypothetical protein [Anaerolineae bacterium]MCO5190516.1 hypothetical protein [Anaerolineae bacterium]MCO5193391.1 hypothetical protein [Anaerolineae bacterium]MCO5198787.1 hypothetical protein [Anaerolineae bacterium]MCO5207893.1 hypothetical protein [Anaerolineae bacterium]